MVRGSACGGGMCRLPNLRADVMHYCMLWTFPFSLLCSHLVYQSSSYVSVCLVGAVCKCVLPLCAVVSSPSFILFAVWDLPGGWGKREVGE